MITSTPQKVSLSNLRSATNRLMELSVLKILIFYCKWQKDKVRKTHKSYLKFHYLCVSMNILNQHIDQIKRLCELNNVSSLFAFGSVTTDKFRPDSDIDLIVEIDDNDPISYSDKYFNLKFQLEKLLNRQIDLLEHKAIRNRFLKNEIDRTKVQIYGKRSPTLA